MINVPDSTASAAWRGAECAEIVTAGQQLCSLLKLPKICRAPNPPGIALSQRVSQRAAKHPVPVAPGKRLEAGVEIFPCRADFSCGDVAGQVGIERRQQILRTMLPVQVKRNDLSRGVNSGIRAPGG